MKLTVSATILGVLISCLFLAAVEASSYCKVPPRPRYGRHDGGWQVYFGPGKGVRFTCYSGYKLQGAAVLTCVYSRQTRSYQWNNPSPKCVSSEYLENVA